MIQDISPHVFSNAFTPRPPREGDRIIIFGDEKVLLLVGDIPGGSAAASEGGKPGGSPAASGDAKPGEPAIPAYEQLRAVAPEVLDRLIYLFCIDDISFFYLRADALACETAKKFTETAAYSFRTYGETWLGFAGVTACHLAGWYERHRICGKCGELTRLSDKERMIECPVCGQTYYPRISPAVIVGVTDGEKLLLTRYANRPVGSYALIAGFCEIGESVEDTVRREVMEEVGVSVQHIRFYKSQPWGFSSSLLMGFYCDLDGCAEITLDQNELGDAEWFERNAINSADLKISLTGEMIEMFRRGVT